MKGHDGFGGGDAASHDQEGGRSRPNTYRPNPFLPVVSLAELPMVSLAELYPVSLAELGVVSLAGLAAVTLAALAVISSA